MSEKPSHKMATEILEAIAVVGDRHGLHPSKPEELKTLLTTFGAVMMAILRTGVPSAHGITIRDETRKGQKGTAITVHYNEEEPAA